MARINKAVWIALIRAIGPATHKKMSMQQLRDSCSSAGLTDVTTILATGNILFSSTDNEREISKSLTEVIESHGLDNEVFLRQPLHLEAVIARNPFTDAAVRRPHHLLVQFLAHALSPEQIPAIEDYDGPERVVVVGREVFIDYVDGVGHSKLTPATLERRLKQSGTARNWNTVRKLLYASREL
jgi:uncharacterized protein (DUF1697 family)